MFKYSAPICKTDLPATSPALEKYIFLTIVVWIINIGILLASVMLIVLAWIVIISAVHSTYSPDHSSFNSSFSNNGDTENIINLTISGPNAINNKERILFKVHGKIGFNLAKLSILNESSSDFKKSGEVVKEENKKSFFLKGLKNLIDRKNIPDILESIDHILIAVTIFITGGALAFIGVKLFTPDLLCAETSKKARDMLLLTLKLLITGTIDKLILSMTTITIVLTFLINILRVENNIFGVGLLYGGIGIGFLITAIAAYIYLTSRCSELENKNL